MPIGPWIVPAISAGASLLENLFGGGKQKSGYQMSPYEKMMLQEMMNEYQNTNVPGSVTAPYYQLAGDIKQKYAEQPGSSGLEIANLQKFAYAPMSEVSTNYLENKKQRLAALIASITRETGTSWAQGAPDFSGVGEDIGSIIWEILNRQKAGGGGGGAQYSPELKFGYTPPNPYHF